MGKKAECAKTVVKGNNNGALGGKMLGIVLGSIAGAAKKTAAVNPEHYRIQFILGPGRCPDIQVQAVFTAQDLLCPWRKTALYAAWTELRGGSDTGPGCRRLWRTPAIFTHRRGGVGYAAKHGDITVVGSLSLDEAGFYHDGFRQLGRSHHWH